MSFSAKLDLLRKGFARKSSAARTVPEMRDLLKTIAKQVDREKAALYIFKELLDVYMELEDEQQDHREVLFESFSYLLEQCQEANVAIKKSFVPYVNNVIAKIFGKENKRLMTIQCCKLLNQCPMGEHQDLFYRVSKVALKVVCDLNARKPKTSSSAMEQCLSDGLDFICTVTLQLVRHWSLAETGEERSKALTIFHDMFNNSTALLYRIFNLESTKASQLFRTFVDIFRKEAKFSEKEIVGLFSKSISYLESILSLGEVNKQYLEFAGFVEIFDVIEQKPVASFVEILKMYLNFQSDFVPDVHKLTGISDQLRVLAVSFVSDPLLIDLVVFIVMQMRIHLGQLKQRAQGIALEVIDLCKTLTKFVRHCPKSLSQVCSRCSNSDRHLVDYIASMVAQEAMIAAKEGKDITPELFAVVNGFIRNQLLTLEAMSCEKKLSLIDSALRYTVNWVRICSRSFTDKDLIELVRTLIDYKYRYKFDFLTPNYLMRLMENCLKETLCCATIIDIKLIRIMLALRDETVVAGDFKEIEEAAYIVVNYQMNSSDEKLQDMNLIELIERSDRETFGFPNEQLSDSDKVTILFAEISWASRFKPSKTLDYIHLLLKLRADPLKLGMTIYMLQDGTFSQLSEKIVEKLTSKIKNARPDTNIDKIRRYGSLAVLSYYAYESHSKTIVSRLKNCPLHKDSLQNDQINEVLQENLMDNEAASVELLEETYSNFRQMVMTMAESSFQHFNLIYSLNQISSMLSNICHFYQIFHHPKRSVELQLLCYVLVSQKADRPLDLCRSLGFLIENHQLFLELLQDPLYCKLQWVPTLEQLINKTVEIIENHESNFLSVPETRRYHFLSLYLAVALNNAHKGALKAAVASLQKLNPLLKQLSTHCSSTVSIVRGRTYHVLFRLITCYGLSTPCEMPPRIFIRMMLSHFNEIQKLQTDHTFSVTTATLEMTIDTVRYLIPRYSAGEIIEPYVEQILRFILRRGAGLRALQVFALYAAFSADSEKFDKCRMLLTYMDRILMFRPLETDRKDQLSSKSVESIQQVYEQMEIPLIELDDRSSPVDQTRKAAKYLKSPSKRSCSPNLLPESQVDGRQYIIQHHTSCTCQYCRYPQYKCLAIIAAAGYARLAFLQQRFDECKNLYQIIVNHWDRKRTYYSKTPDLMGYREEFIFFLARSFMHYGQYLVKSGELKEARRLFETSIEVIKGEGNHELVMIEEIQMNLLSLQDIENSTATKESVSVLSYEDFLKNNPDLEITSLLDVGRLELKTPKVRTNKIVPRTACRADDLLKQVARKHLKTYLTKDYTQESEIITAISGLSVASEKKPKAVSIFIDSPENSTGFTIKKSNTNLFGSNPKEAGFSPKKKGRKKKPDGETPAAPKSTRKKRIALSPTVKTSSSNESFKDTLIKGIDCSTPKVSGPIAGRAKCRSTSKKPKLAMAFPRLKDTVESTSPDVEEKQVDQSLNGSYRDVLLKSLVGSKKLFSKESSDIIVLDNSTDQEDVVNTSLFENLSVTETNNGALSLRKYSDRKLANAISSTNSSNKPKTKTRLVFDTSGVIDITTPVSSPVVDVAGASRESSTGSSSSEVVVRRPRGRPPKGSGKTPKPSSDHVSSSVTHRRKVKKQNADS
ncbi:uncharacterized protein LOC129732890 [Wyeomyia smithii]|uniref:uncharacterized protein LOC129732890 n=1 Tax=Wyeomyia smithii TaxID=174621 RepID=UPI002467EB73|nr:uncharacterized protein LOC129732890 [Wyeomyia smithii]